MDSLIKQTRRRHPSAQAKTDEVGSPTREKKVPPRKSVSFKEDKKKPSNWLEKQLSRQMSDQSYDSIIDMDYAAAVAAAAYAITTFETTWLESYYSGREDAFPLEETRSLSRRFSGQLSFKEPEIQPPVRTRSERRAPPPPPPPPPLLSPSPLRLPPRETKRPSSGGTSREHDSTADAWEKAELAKVKARYEKLNRKIDLWEAKKRDKARRKLDKSEQSEQEQRRKRGLQRFREDMEYIENIASGARAQAEKQRQDEELKVKERAGVVRKTGKIPGKACACF
ncbi:Remorin family protein [Raphanus sativus]|nr:Remorin family protein [Raphanus sativus]